jgi:small redox-active disulfide protein 2
MKIKVLGPGCANCKDMERRVNDALKELGFKSDIEHVTDFGEISKYVLLTPGLVINGKVKHSGKPLPKPEKIKEWIKEASKDTPAKDENVSKRKGSCGCGSCDCGE